MNFEFLKEKDYEAYIKLIKSSFGHESTVENIKRLGENTRILVLKDEDNLVGTGMIRYIYDPIKDKKTLYLDYICVSDDYRNQGIGKKVMQEIYDIAKREGVNRLELTSNSKRCYARKMYMSFGMTIRDTDVFHMDVI